ncbi:hypothetical protein ABPG72_004583 [Tetrahymena utriculariae]
MLMQIRDQLLDILKPENQDSQNNSDYYNFFSKIPLENYLTLSKPRNEKQIQFIYEEAKEIKQALLSQRVKTISNEQIQIKQESEIENELKNYVQNKFEIFQKSQIFRQFLIQNIVENTQLTYEQKIRTLEEERENLKNFVSYKNKIDQMKRQGNFSKNDVRNVEELFQLIQMYNCISQAKFLRCQYPIEDIIQNITQIQDNILTISCFFMHSSNVEKLIQQHQQHRVDRVIILANHAFIVDQNKFTFKGGQLAIKCKKFIISNNAQLIDLSGQDAKQFQNNAAIGQDGLPGRPGQNGGSFLLLVQEIISQQNLRNQNNQRLIIYVIDGQENNHQNEEFKQDRQNSLCYNEKDVQIDQKLLQNLLNNQSFRIDITGGRGGDGQNGGNGLDGENGQDGDLNRIQKRDKNLIVKTENITSKLKNLASFNSQYNIFYQSLGQIGQNGGNAGRGGRGGLQGYPGECQILSFDGTNIQTQTLYAFARNGQNGQSGIAGNGGLGGRNAMGIFQDEFICPTLRGITKKMEQKNLTENFVESAASTSSVATAGAAIGIISGEAAAAAGTVGLARFIAWPVGVALTALQIGGSIISANIQNGFIDGPRFTNTRAQNGQNGNRPISLNQQNFQNPAIKLNLKKNQFCYKFQEVCSIFCLNNHNCALKN